MKQQPAFPELVVPSQVALLEPGPTLAMAQASLKAYDAILPTLNERKWEVFLLLADYCAATGYADATGGELAKWSGRDKCSIRPRLTNLCDDGLICSWAIRPSRAGEMPCHPYSIAVPREAIERARRARAAKGRG